MKTDPRPWTDPIVEEVRQVRDELLREAGGDLGVALARAKEWRQRHTRAVNGTYDLTDTATQPGCVSEEPLNPPKEHQP